MCKTKGLRLLVVIARKFCFAKFSWQFQKCESIPPRHTEGFSPKYPKHTNLKNIESMPQKRINKTLLGRLKSNGLEGFYFWQKPNKAKTFYRFAPPSHCEALQKKLHLLYIFQNLTIIVNQSFCRRSPICPRS